MRRVRGWFCRIELQMLLTENWCNVSIRKGNASSNGRMRVGKRPDGQKKRDGRVLVP